MASQDANEIYASFFEYSREWAGYIKGCGRIADAGLAKMRTFGRWRIDDPQAIDSLAELILAIALVHFNFFMALTMDSPKAFPCSHRRREDAGASTQPENPQGFGPGLQRQARTSTWCWSLVTVW